MSWQEEFIHFTELERIDLRESILNQVSKDKKGASFVQFLKSNCDFIGFTPGIDFIKPNSTKITLVRFQKPLLLYYVRKNPVLILLDSGVKRSTLTAPVEAYVRKKRHTMGFDEDSRYLEWVSTFANSSNKTKEEYKNTLLEQGIKKHQNGEKIFNLLEADADLEGYAITVNYFKETGEGEEMIAEFEHPFGGATLFYRLKYAPAYLLTNPTLRFNNSYLKEVGENRYKGSILGITD